MSRMQARAGFSLLEVVVASVVLMVTLTGLGAIIMAHAGMALKTQSITMAELLANQELDRIDMAVMIQNSMVRDSGAGAGSAASAGRSIYLSPAAVQTSAYFFYDFPQDAAFSFDPTTTAVTGTLMDQTTDYPTAGGTCAMSGASVPDGSPGYLAGTPLTFQAGGATGITCGLYNPGIAAKLFGFEGGQYPYVWLNNRFAAANGVLYDGSVNGNPLILNGPVTDANQPAGAASASVPTYAIRYQLFGLRFDQASGSIDLDTLSTIYVTKSDNIYQDTVTSPGTVQDKSNPLYGQPSPLIADSCPDTYQGWGPPPTGQPGKPNSGFFYLAGDRNKFTAKILVIKIYSYQQYVRNAYSFYDAATGEPLPILARASAFIQGDVRSE